MPVLNYALAVQCANLGGAFPNTAAAGIAAAPATTAFMTARRVTEISRFRGQAGASVSISGWNRGSSEDGSSGRMVLGSGLESSRRPQALTAMLIIIGLRLLGVTFVVCMKLNLVGSLPGRWLVVLVALPTMMAVTEDGVGGTPLVVTGNCQEGNMHESMSIGCSKLT